MALDQPYVLQRLAYSGTAFRPFGGLLYRPRLPSPPLALIALKRRRRRPPLVYRPYRGRRRSFRPYAGYFLRLEAPFVEQPVALASFPTLRRLSKAWTSAWLPADLEG